MFIVSLTYHASLDQIDAHLEEHIAFLKEHYAQGTFLASGRKVPRTGGVILATAPSREALESIVQSDPFFVHHLSTYEITEVAVSMSAPALSSLINR
jgi:uncharacterized protein YciI